jgi:hypothetical protein
LGFVKKFFAVLGRLRDLEAYSGNDFGGGATAALSARYGVVLRADAAEKNLGDRFAFCASELKQRHGAIQAIPAGEASTLGELQKSRKVSSVLASPREDFFVEYWTTELHVNLPSAR